MGRRAGERQQHPPFGRVPTEIIASGILAELNGTEARLYLAICGFNGGRSWSATISIGRLAEIIDKSKRTVQRTVNRLVERGLIQVKAGGGRETPNTFFVNTNPDAVNVTVSGAKTRQSGRHRLCEKPRQNEPEAPTTLSVKGDTQSVTRSEVHSLQSAKQEEGSEPNDEVVRHFAIRGGSTWPLTQSRLDRYREAFPELDVDHEIWMAALWCNDNPNRRKTAKGMPAFLTNWLKRARDRQPQQAGEQNDIAANHGMVECGPADPNTPGYRSYSVTVDTMNIKADEQALLDELQRAGCEVFHRKKIRCGFHDDRTPSAGVYQGEDGCWRFKCHGGECGFHGDLFDVRANATGKPLDAVLREAGEQLDQPVQRNQHPHRRHQTNVYDSIQAMEATIRDRVSTYPYHDPDTHDPALIVFRLGSKRFLQARPSDGGFVFGGVKPAPLFNRGRVRRRDHVIFVEGEKDVLTLHRYGYVATTGPGGCENADNLDLSPLSGKASVTLWPDADQAGARYMNDIAKRLEGLPNPPTVHRIDPGELGLSDGQDVSDLVGDSDDDTAAAAIREALATAQSTGPASEVGELIEATISGRRAAVDWPWPLVSRMAKALLPGSVTLLAGERGSTKSFLLLQAMEYWYRQGVSSVIFELEEDRRYHLYRALAQLAGSACLFDDEWVRANPDEARTAYNQHRDYLDPLGKRIHAAPDHEVSLDDVGKWIEQRAIEGYRVIVVDPITVASTSDKRWQDDQRFINTVKKIGRQYETSIVLATHPKKGWSGASLDDLAGGASYARLAQTILWLETHNEPKTVTVRTHFGD